MPIMDGYSASKRLNYLIAKEKIYKVPIIACTADVTESNLEKCKKAGFTDVLLKPISV